MYLHCCRDVIYSSWARLNNNYTLNCYVIKGNNEFSDCKSVLPTANLVLMASHRDGSVKPEESKKTAASVRRAQREDVKVLALGVGVSFVLTLAMKLLEYRLRDVPHDPDKGPFIYYWVLPNPTAVTRLSAWGLYACHQVAHWALIYYAQTHTKTTTVKLHPVNYAALAVNLFFSILHLVQTHVFYDGLAQDTHEVSPQVSVIIMLIWVLLMENYTRGMIAGYPLPISKELIHFARKYHAYYFSWAIVYTFWYHPMETTPGHLVGFLYTFLLFLQGSLFFTRIHLNPWWKLCLELIVALNQPGNMWPMFLFGFLGVFVLTQVYARIFSQWVKVVCTTGFVVCCIVAYRNKPFYQVNEPIRIPIIDYLGVLILSGVLYAVMKLSMFFQYNSQSKRIHD